MMMSKALKWYVVAALALGVVVTADLHAFTLTLQAEDPDGNPVSGFRWLVEEDTTYPVTPGVPVPDSLALNIHKSYAPVVAKGTSLFSTTTVDVPDDKRYFVSVLPASGHAMGGATVAVGQGTVTVVVNPLPLPTAQISVFVFHDNQPINGAPDVPAEAGLEGFSVRLADAAGQMVMDAFGNMVGTTYRQNPDGSFVVDAEGSPVVDTPGTSIITTDGNGKALIKFLAPGKYGVQVIPPPGETDWVQTATIEGTPTIDAWVKAGEPPYFAEWGFFDWHVFVGFVKPMTLPASGGPTGTISGQAVYTHDNRPPLAPGLNPGVPIDAAWIGLNNLSGNDEQVYAQPCGEDGVFTIENVPPGTYQLVIWDEPLDATIDFRTIIVPAEGGAIEMGKVPVYAWYGFLEGKVFLDTDGDGYPDPDEPGVRNQAINLRFIDGSIYQFTQTDPAGNYSFDEVFPFFHWLIVEVDFARFKATGATMIVDEGGELPFEGAHNTPQIDPGTGLPYRTETGEVLTQGMLLYAGQTNEIHWGKVAYGPGENGGISGIVYYATTRAEDDPRFAAGEEWEPGIPLVQVNLYQDADNDGVIDDLDDPDDVPTLADVDNFPFDWMESGIKGDEDVDRNGNGVFDPGDAISITHTDSWDENMPSGAVGPPQFVYIGGVPFPIRDGAETLRTWNQLRPGVFDGGYAFASYVPGGIVSGNPEVEGLPGGYYIVEAVAPRGYEHVKEEDKNVDFGDEYTPSEGEALLYALPPLPHPPARPVGDLHQVPAELTLFPGVEAPFAGEWRPLPDRKQAFVSEGENAAADFFLFTEVPKAGRIWGVVFNDVLLEFNPDSPNKGTNFAPSWMPIAIKDFRGNELVRVYTDQWGKYSALVPSTYTVNLPTPTGVSPAVLTVCINDPGPILDPANPGEYIIDPWYDPGYSQICTNWDFWPGKTTRLDTPILPIGAFTANRTPLDCEFPDGTPAIYSVSGPYGGPYVRENRTQQITILSVGPREVPNPDYDPTAPGSTPTVTRDYGFGADAGSVTVNGTELEIVNWGEDSVTARVTKSMGLKTGQLLLTRGDNGKTTGVGITLHLGNTGDIVHVTPGESIQTAIDTAKKNSVILVAPGVYKENPIMWKPVKLQGWGAYSTFIQAGPMLPDEQLAWDAKLQELVNSQFVALIEGERPDFYLERGAGVTVITKRGQFRSNKPPCIDGFTIQGAIKGGGIFVNAYGSYLHISNNRITSNQGSFGGGIRIGTPSLVNDRNDGYESSSNMSIKIHHNHIRQNGAVDGGGGVAIFNGAHEYSITENFICGNFSLLYGGGIAHFGLSDDGVIANNKIVSNQAFDEGGGVMVAGELVPAGAPAGTLTPGAGSVTVAANLIQGNIAGDDGGGLRTLMVNGQEVERYPTRPNRWYTVEILNNMIVNNSSADAGGGIALDDTARVFIINNTVTHNDSTSTGVDAFGGPIDEENMPPELAAILPPEAGEAGFLGGLTTSVPQVAGIAANAHSTGLQAAFGPGFEQLFSNPVLEDNIIWQNRSFFWQADHGPSGGLRPDIGGGEAPTFWDLAVHGTVTAQKLDPRNGILTDATGYDTTNLVADPLLVDPYFNVYQATSKGAAFGNFVSVTFKPNGIVGDYHIQTGSPAVDLGGGAYLATFPELAADYDRDARPAGGGPDAGADEAE